MTEKTPPTHTRPISATLEKELRKQAIKGLVVFMDERGHYVRFIDALRARAGNSDAFPFPIVSHRGSFIETMLAMREVAEGQDQRPAILHITGIRHDSDALTTYLHDAQGGEPHRLTIKQTPLIEAYYLGKPFARDLSALIEQTASGKVSPRDLRDFLAMHGDSLTLEIADQWLEAHALIARSGLDKRLLDIKPDTLIELLFNPDDLLKAEYDADIIWPHLHRLLGLDEAWRAFVHQRPMGLDEEHDPRANLLAIAFTVTAWCLCVEYVHDLKREPFIKELKPLTGLSKPLIDSCRVIAEHLREAHPDRYEQIVSEFEPRLQAEIERGNARELGKVDTFQFEQRRIFEEALGALDSGEFDLVLEWADARQREHSFWVRRKPQHDAAWRLVERAAHLGQLIARHPHPLEDAMGLSEAIELYTELAAPVDRAHRLLEQRRKSLLDVCISINGFARLRERLDLLRRRYRRWSDDLARRFNALCLEHGFTPTQSLQQRHLFDQEVRPHALKPDVKVAFFMVDALRYEMAEELMRDLQDLEEGVTLSLKPRLCELPSVTAVGMNALAPIAPQGTLEPILDGHAFKGFKTNEFQVTRPDDRIRAIQHRIGTRKCEMRSLQQILDAPSHVLQKELKKIDLLVVHSQELDEAGEKGLGLTTFEHTLRDLQTAMRLLREAGVEHVIMSADHGYLLLDHTTAHDRLLQHAGSKTDADRRHLVYPVHTVQDGRVTVSLSALGYLHVEGFLMLPEDTSIFDRGARNQLFVHGGNAPQERVIPVLHAHFDPIEKGTKRTSPDRADLLLDITPSQGIMGLHAVKVSAKSEQSQGTLFGDAPHIALSLRIPRADVEGDTTPNVAVEIADVRGEGASLKGSVMRVPVGEEVEIFFTLSSDTPMPKLPIELYSPTRSEHEITPVRSLQRYAVTALLPLKKSEPSEAIRERTEEAPPAQAPEEEETRQDPIETPHASPAHETSPEELAHLDSAVKQRTSPQPDEAAAQEPQEVVEEEAPLEAELGAQASEIEYAGWEDLPRDGTQKIFEHLARHGSITEPEATKMLGSARQFRRFARRIDEYISHVSFDVRVEVIGTTKRYIREDNQ